MPPEHSSSVFVQRLLFFVLAAPFSLLGQAARADEPGTLADPSEPVAIIGGGPSQPCAWPSTVFLENCTGTLIHPEIVVYAAHCDAERERVWFGEDVSTGTVAPGEGFSVETEYCMVNPKWSTTNQIGPKRAEDYAFCKLAEPVLDVPIVPPAMGCETTALLPGTPVTLVGFGTTDQETFAVKFQVDTVLHYIDEWGAAVIGGGGFSPCAGDSGGPAFMQLPDGSWRAFGIVGGPNVGNCGDAMWFATIYNAIPFIEANSGIDVSACHHSHGEWNPSPSCEEFPLQPGDGEGKSWADGCAGGPVSGPSTACGPAFDSAEDLVGPLVAITMPADRTRFDTGVGGRTYPVDVVAEATDDISGVSRVHLQVNGAFVENSLRLGPPWAWELDVPPGVWEIEAVATDWADNEVASEAIVIGIDTDPPPKPDPPPDDTGDGGLDSTGGEPPAPADTSTGPADGSSSDGGGDTTSGAVPSADGGGGCGCRQSGPGGAPRWAWLVLGLAALSRTRRRAALGIAAAIASGCGDDPVASPTGTSSTGDAPASSSGVGTTAAADTTGADEETSSTSTGTPGGSSSDAAACEPGTLDCTCTSDLQCGAGLSCWVNTCIECAAGTFACPCIFEGEGDREGACEDGLFCVADLCAAPQPCPFVRDGECDEPQGTGFCLPGTDTVDCEAGTGSDSSGGSDSGGASTDTGRASTDTGGASTDTGDASTDTGGASTDTSGDASTDTGGESSSGTGGGD